MDFTGMDRFLGVLSYASELRKRVLTETGHPISIGLSNIGVPLNNIILRSSGALSIALDIIL